MNFLKQKRFLWRKIDHAIGNDYIKTIVFQRQEFGINEMNLPVVRGEDGKVCAGFLYHCRCQIDSGDCSGIASQLCRNIEIKSAAAADVEYICTVLEWTKLKWIADTAKDLQ